jgi:hypothetical protein
MRNTTVGIVWELPLGMLQFANRISLPKQQKENGSAE